MSIKSSSIFLSMGLLSLGILGAIIYFFSPLTVYTFFTFPIPLLYIFFLPLGASVFFLGTFLLKSKKHGVLIALFVITYLIFRLNDLTHPFFLILLLAIFLTLELFFAHKKKPEARLPQK